MDRGAWWAIVHGVRKSWTRLSTRVPPYSEGRPHVSSISVTWEWLSNSDSQAPFKQDPQVTHLMLKFAMHCSGAAHCQIDSSGEDQTGELLWE